MIAGAYALYQLDLYTLIPLFVVELAILYVRKKTLSLVLPCVLHIISATLTLAVRDYATDSSQLLGTQMGALQVIGLAILFAGAALPVLAVGARLMGDLKNRSMLQKGLLVLFSLVLIASGYAISRI